MAMYILSSIDTHLEQSYLAILQSTALEVSSGQVQENLSVVEIVEQVTPNQGDRCVAGAALRTAQQTSKQLAL